MNHKNACFLLSMGSLCILLSSTLLNPISLMAIGVILVLWGGYHLIRKRRNHNESH